ncbi:hypothetical protein [Desulfocurvus sp. DL9XJH121]
MELGGGFVHCAHGIVPVPASVMEADLYGGIRPTDAAILVGLTDCFAAVLSLTALGAFRASWACLPPAPAVLPWSISATASRCLQNQPPRSGLSERKRPARIPVFCIPLARRQ